MVVLAFLARAHASCHTKILVFCLSLLCSDRQNQDTFHLQEEMNGFFVEAMVVLAFLDKKVSDTRERRDQRRRCGTCTAAVKTPSPGPALHRPVAHVARRVPESRDRKAAGTRFLKGGEPVEHSGADLGC
jgi:hypothetical protein